jgi:hypothetical protein
MHISDISAINCRADLTGICDGLLSSHLKQQPRIHIVKWHLQLLTKKYYCNHDINCISVLKHQTTDWSPLPTSNISRSKVWNKIFSSTKEVIVGLEGLYSNQVSSASKTFPFSYFAFFRLHL